MSFRLPLVALVSVAAWGCSDPVRPSISIDLGSPVDAVADTPPADRPADVTPTDVAADVPVDVPVDVPSTDAATDVASTDAATDIPSTDAATDVPVDAPADVPMDGELDAALTDAALTDSPLDDAGLGAWITLGTGACGARARRVAALAGSHVDPDAGPIAWLTNPPSSGNHYDLWARWGAWPDLARGNWVHNLEHGGVAFLYRCATAPCTETRDALVAAMNSLPTDPACMPTDASPARVRVVITNDNLITTPIAAAAWGAVYEATCVDAASLREFYAMFAGRAPEDFCADGYVP